jgi:hypothetical protein
MNYGYKATRPGPDAIVDDYKAKLSWLAAHPGEWLWWSWRSTHASTLRAPLFERHFVSPAAELTILAGTPMQKRKPGLWLRLDL